MKFKQYAFTLAETLITLGIIGVVAAITLPALITNIQDRIKEKRVQNIQQKFSKATDKMLATSGLNGYESTLDFVNELKNHLSIAKICENDELRNCWPTEKVTLADGKEWEISKTQKAKHLKMTNDDNHEWDDTVGIITADGTSIILSYNKKCDIDPVTTPSWDSNKSNSTNCIAAVFDWNGSSKPNKFGAGDVKRKADVFALNANGLGSKCAIEANGKCFGSVFKSNPVTKAECESMISTHGINGCRFEPDYWAGAVKQCGHVNKMASPEDLAMIASQLYVGNPTIGATEDKTDLTYITNSATSLGLPEPFFFIWTNTEEPDALAGSVYFRNFQVNKTQSGWTGRTGANALSLCIIE